VTEFQNDKKTFLFSQENLKTKNKEVVMSTTSINERLLSAQVMIDNTMSDDAIKNAVALFGYDDTKVAAGKALLDSVNALHQTQIKEYGEQYEASDSLKKAREAANLAYMRLLKIARIALKDDVAAYQKLNLLGDRRQSLSGWLGQSKQFFLNMLEDASIQGKMANFGITLEQIQAGKALVDQVEAANATHKKEMGEAQQATINRDSKMDELDSWLTDYVAIARIALEDTPQYLEKLGIIQK
jgi:hypothetical protein